MGPLRTRIWSCEEHEGELKSNFPFILWSEAEDIPRYMVKIQFTRIHLHGCNILPHQTTHHFLLILQYFMCLHRTLKMNKKKSLTKCQSKL